MAELTISLASHHFVIRNVTLRARSVVYRYVKKYIQYERQFNPYSKTYYYEPKKTYGARVEDDSEFRFHINQLEEFKSYLRVDEINDDMVEWCTEPTYEPKKVTIKIKPGWEIWPDQEGAVTYCLDDDPVRKLLAMDTGTGKSFVSMYVAAKIGYRTAYFMSARYIDKWLVDFKKTIDFVPKDLVVIQGTPGLKKLMQIAKDTGDISASLLLISSETYRSWLKAWEKWGRRTLDMGYACTPGEFFELLRIGVRIIDEAHENFFLVFKFDLYTHIYRAISMSATMHADDAFEDQMIRLAYPIGERFQGPKKPAYISSLALTYHFAEPGLIRSDGNRGYSHVDFEHSVLKHKLVAENYAKMIAEVVYGELIVDHRPGERMIVFCSTKDMCSFLMNYMRKWYGDLTVSRYCSSDGDPFENILTSDLTFTTPGSAGTNVDIPMLKCALMTVAVRSSRRNIQGAGRLRDNLPSGRTSRFVTTVCKDIPKHTTFHEERMQLLKEKCIGQSEQSYLPLL